MVGFGARGTIPPAQGRTEICISTVPAQRYIKCEAQDNQHLLYAVEVLRTERQTPRGRQNTRLAVGGLLGL